MAGWNKRAAVAFVAEMQRAIRQLLIELRDELDKEELRARGLQGVADDIADATTQILMHETLVFRMLSSAARPFCRLVEDHYGYPGRAVGHIEWRGNAVSIGIAIRELIGGRRHIIRDISLRAATKLGPMLCCHVGEKRRIPREPALPAFVDFAAGMAALDSLQCIEFYVRCEDCGEEVWR